MIHWVPGARLLSFKHQETKLSFSNSKERPTLFLIVK